MIGRARAARHETPHRRHRRRRASTKVRALLAGGLVLGVGASTTLAAWNDSESVTGTVTAGTFELQGSTDGSTYASQDSPHAVTFSPDAALLPGDSTYALFSVRTAPGSAGGQVTLEADAGNAEGLGAALDYGVATVGGTTCDSETFASGGDGTAPQSLEGDAGSTVNYCLRLTLPDDAPNDVQGASVDPQWHATGTTTSG